MLNRNDIHGRQTKHRINPREYYVKKIALYSIKDSTLSLPRMYVMGKL